MQHFLCRAICFHGYLLHCLSLFSLCMLFFAGFSLCILYTLVFLWLLWLDCLVTSWVVSHVCNPLFLVYIIFLCVYLCIILFIISLAYISSYTCIFVFSCTNTCLLATLFTCDLVSTKHIPFPLQDIVLVQRLVLFWDAYSFNDFVCTPNEGGIIWVNLSPHIISYITQHNTDTTQLSVLDKALNQTWVLSTTKSFLDVCNQGKLHSSLTCHRGFW